MRVSKVAYVSQSTVVLCIIIGMNKVLAHYVCTFGNDNTLDVFDMI